MTKEQINFIFNQHGGKENVIKNMMFEVFFDNPRNFILDANLSKEKRLESIVFDDANEVVIMKETNRLFSTINDYMPTNTTLYIGYEHVQGIYIMTGKTE